MTFSHIITHEKWRNQSADFNTEEGGDNASERKVQLQERQRPTWHSREAKTATGLVLLGIWPGMFQNQEQERIRAEVVKWGRWSEWKLDTRRLQAQGSNSQASRCELFQELNTTYGRQWRPSTAILPLWRLWCLSSQNQMEASINDTLRTGLRAHQQGAHATCVALSE